MLAKLHIFTVRTIRFILQSISISISLSIFRSISRLYSQVQYQLQSQHSQQSLICSVNQIGLQVIQILDCRPSFRKPVLWIIFGCFFTSPVVQAKELQNRMGVGFRNAYGIDVPSIAATYYPNSQFAVLGAVGIDTQKDQAKSAFSGGLRRILFREPQMNFFTGGYLSMLSNETTTGTDSGFEISAVVGGEFFFTGLDSLGFNFETGAGVTNLGRTRFRTLGDHMFRAGMFFYF